MEHVLDGTDLILSVGGGALAFSTGCKMTTQTETGERVTKEAASGKWKEKYVKSYSESISADSVVCTDGTTDAPTYDQLKDLQLSGKPVDVSYNVREAGSRSGKTTGGYKGKFIITSLDLDAQAGDDAKCSIQLENCGKVEKQATGLQGTTASQSDSGAKTTK
jgi:predicted secreted protein